MGTHVITIDSSFYFALDTHRVGTLLILGCVNVVLSAHRKKHTQKRLHQVGAAEGFWLAEWVSVCMCVKERKGEREMMMMIMVMIFWRIGAGAFD